MRRKEKVLQVLTPLDQKLFFFYVRVKLLEEIKQELKRKDLESNNFIGFFKDKKFETSVDEYRLKLNELSKRLDVDMEFFPASAFQIIAEVVDLVNFNHPIFVESIPHHLFCVRYKIFITQIYDIMQEEGVKKFDFFAMPEGDQKKVAEFFEESVFKIQNIKEKIVEKLHRDKSIRYGYVDAYLLYEATMGYVRNDSKNRENIICSAFGNLKYDDILANYERITHRIKAHQIKQPSAGEIEEIKKDCITWLVEHIKFYADKLMKKEEVSQDDIQNSQQMKILFTMLHSLDLKNSDDRDQILVILKFILQDTFPGGVNKDGLKAYNQFVEIVLDEDLTSLQRELLKEHNKIKSKDESPLKSGMFPERKPVDDDSDEENVAPPKGGNITQPPSPKK